MAALKIKRVADLGAGNGGLCAQLAVKRYEVVGIEQDRNGVDIASRTYPNARFYQFGVHDDPAELLEAEAVFDAVVSTEVIEHLYSPRLLPRHAWQILVPGGHLIISTPYHGYIKNLALSVLDKWDHHHTALWEGGHIKFWSQRTLTALLTQNGFEVLSFSGVGRVPYLWKSMVVVASKVS